MKTKNKLCVKFIPQNIAYLQLDHLSHFRLNKACVVDPTCSVSTRSVIVSIACAHMSTVDREYCMCSYEWIY